MSWVGGRTKELAVIGGAALVLAACAAARTRPDDASPPPPTAHVASSGATRGANQPLSRPGEPSSEKRAIKLPLEGLPSGPIPTDLGSAASLNSGVLSHASAPIAAEALPLGPGDVIEISVFEVPELSDLQRRIPLDGRIMFPLLGTLDAGGRTAAQLRDEIRTRLQQKYMHDPQVAVLVVEQRSHRISVLGAVRKGGVLTFSGPLRLADAIAMAEGLADDADRIVYLTRRVPAGTVARGQDGNVGEGRATPVGLGGQTEQVMTTIDLADLARGNEALNVPLQAGDVITVPAAGSYYVGGEVQNPGTFRLRGRTTLDQAIINAGGVRKVADWSDIRIYRPAPGGKQDVLRFNLSDIEQGQTPPNVRKNDVVLVGKSGSKAFAYGVVDFFKRIFNVGVDVGASARAGF